MSMKLSGNCSCFFTIFWPFHSCLYAHSLRIGSEFTQKSWTVTAGWAYPVHIICRNPCNSAYDKPNSFELELFHLVTIPVFVNCFPMSTLCSVRTLMVTNCGGERCFAQSLESRVIFALLWVTTAWIRSSLSLLCIESEIMRMQHWLR